MGKFKLDKRSQGNLLGYYAEDFLPEGHLAYVVDEIVKHLDTKEIEDKYSDIGQNSYPPKIMIKIIFYGYTIGIFSSRKLANACERDVAFIYLASSYKPDFRTISDFRKDNLEVLNEYFVEVLKYCELIGLRTAEKIGIDGSKFRANASSRRSKDIEGYERWERNIREQIKKLQSKGIEKDEEEDRIYKEVEEEKVPKQIRKKEALLEKIAEAKKELKEMEKVRRKGKKGKAFKLNLTDKDAKFMKERIGVTRANYNAQIAASEDQIIVAADVVKDAGDRKQLGPMIEQAEKHTGKRIEEVYADAGFSGYENYKYIDNKSIDAYIPDQEYNKIKNLEGENIDNPYDKKYFKYDPKTNSYTCPEGKKIEFYKTRNDEYHQNQIIYKGYECPNCPVREKCTKAKYRTITRHKYGYLQEEMRRKLDTPEGKEKYKKRMWMTEPPFGHFKKNLGFRQFLLRGIGKVKGEFTLLCIGYNILKIHKKMRLQVS